MVEGKKEEYIGKVFNKWTVLEHYGRGNRGHPYYLCQCACGRRRPVRADTLKSGVSKNCGCGQFERFAHLYDSSQQYCPKCQNWLPLDAYSKYYRGKVGEQCRECRRKRVVQAKSKLSFEEKKAIYLKNTYGISLEDFYRMVARQGSRCLGCQEIFVPKDLCVDHDHNSGIVRGLLCNNCNTVLGRVKESDGILYRLSAYLTRNPEKLLIYVVGSLRNKRVVEIANKLRENLKYDIFDDYMAAGPEADDYWKLYENGRGRDYIEALKGRAAGHVFNYDRAYIDLADAIVMVMPIGKSCAIEIGYGKSRGKPVYVILDPDHSKDRYDFMKKFVDGLYHNVDELLPLLDHLWHELVAEIKKPQSLLT